MVPIMGKRFTAVLISLVAFTCQWLMPAPAHAAMDVAKQVLIGADYSNKDLRGCLLYTSPSPRDYAASRMPSSA